MSLRSIDLQVIIPRATEVSKVQQISDQQNALKQQENAEVWRKISAERQLAVQNTQKNVGGRITEKNGEQSSKKREQSMAGNQKEKHPTHEEQQENVDPLRGHHIDIKT
ncbi:MAG: hypothetical protein H6Q67_336 [Firmicutes bacterium]|nr:hypothetical protein [Bacillota bacterium]